MWSPTQWSQTRLSGSSSQSWKAPRHHARFEPVHGRKRGQRLLDLLRAGRPRNGLKAFPAGYRARGDLARERRRLRLPGRPCRRCRRARPSLASVRSRAPVRAASAKASPWATGSAMGCAGERSGASKGRSSSNGAGTRRSAGPDPTPSPQKALSRVSRPCESGVRPLILNPTISGSRNARQRKILQPTAHLPGSCAQLRSERAGRLRRSVPPSALSLPLVGGRRASRLGKPRAHLLRPKKTIVSVSRTEPVPGSVAVASQI